MYMFFVESMIYADPTGNDTSKQAAMHRWKELFSE